MENKDSKINIKNDFDDNYELEGFHVEFYEINEQTKNELLTKGLKATCKIILQKENKRGSGFFCEIVFCNKIKKKFLFTCNHILDIENIKLGNDIEIEYKKQKKTITITNERFRITNKDLDYTIIEIFDKDNIEEFYEIYKNHYLESENKYSKMKGAIIHYPSGYDIQIYGGTIKKIESETIFHTITTFPGSSGAPIIILDNNDIIIGIHKGNNIRKNVNSAIYMKYILDDIDKRFSESKKEIIVSKKKKEKK